MYPLESGFYRARSAARGHDGQGHRVMQQEFQDLFVGVGHAPVFPMGTHPLLAEARSQFGK